MFIAPPQLMTPELVGVRSTNSADVATSAPTTLTEPVISGLAVEGSTNLTATDGTYAGGGITKAKQWYDNGVAISGKTSNAFGLVTAGYVGHVLTFGVTPSNDLGTGTEAVSDPVTIEALAAPVNTVAPAITGSDIAGALITGDAGEYTGHFVTITNRWLLDDAEIVGETGANYQSLSTDYGELVKEVTYTNAAGSDIAVSNAITLIAVPVNTVAPVVTGDDVFGSVLTCSTGTCTGGGTQTFAYQWKWGGSAISGATSATYTTLEAQVGGEVTCFVTPSNEAGTGTSVSSNAIEVAAAPVFLVDHDVSSSIPAGCTLTRAATVNSATYFNSSGLQVAVGANVPCFDYDPVTHALRGLLVEPQSANQLGYSDNPSDTTYWTRTEAVVASTAEASPISGATAYSLSNQLWAWALHRIHHSLSLLSTNVVFRCFMKAGTGRYAGLKAGGNKKYSVVFDLQTGQATATHAEGSPAYTAHSITPVGNGWYDVWVATEIISNEQSAYSVFLSDAAIPAAWYYGVPNYTPAAASSVYIQRLCIEARQTPTRMIPTTTDVATRFAEVLSFTIPSGVSTLRFHFDDASTQDVSVSAGAYTVPTNLNLPHLKRIHSLETT